MPPQALVLVILPMADISETAGEIVKGGAVVILGGSAFVIVVKVLQALILLI